MRMPWLSERLLLAHAELASGATPLFVWQLAAMIGGQLHDGNKPCSLLDAHCGHS